VKGLSSGAEAQLFMRFFGTTKAVPFHGAILFGQFQAFSFPTLFRKQRGKGWGTDAVFCAESIELIRWKLHRNLHHG
jgi:hypothetical protein